ncbi:hypothetical protein NPA07_00115 [Mycoplasmopsis caviae]|uniref:Transglutaminase-like domain-containing protein n=1 Tax=Mycoplasmopsis caviae TaxID=55603 RepID=A0A3P8LI25_9BACT|nr:hypothetical protein [Mycoplasmopsis caviae]UUD35274.1 hypothetical protein NPA07_00115 [Mycoplasmopsis caviae]VDR41942.1 Uncharacterised protein [Mycoplasmopsis caviae]
MKKKKILLTLSIGTGFPVLISASCGTKVYNNPNQPNNPTGDLTPTTKRQNQSNPNQPVNPTDTSTKQNDPLVTPTPANPTKKNQQDPPKTGGIKLTEILPSTPINPTPNNSGQNFEPYKKELLPNWIDPNLPTQQLKDKLTYLKHNYGFVDSNKRLNSDKISLRSGKSFQVKLANQELNKNEHDIFIKHGGQVYTLDEYNALDSNEAYLTISERGLVTCKPNIPDTNRDYSDGLIVREKSSNNYFSLHVDVHCNKEREYDEVIENGEAKFKRISMYFTSIEDKVERLLRINNFLMDYITYDPWRANNYYKEQDYFGINNSRAAWDGYSRMVARIAGYSGMKDVLWSGDWLKTNGGRPVAYHTEKHAWNKVKIDNHWYYLDTTWDDSDYRGAYKGKYDMYYFLIKGQEMSESREGIVDTPDEAKEYKLYPFQKENAYFDSIDKMWNSIKRQVITSKPDNNGKYTISLVYPQSLRDSVNDKIGRLPNEYTSFFGNIFRKTSRSVQNLKHFDALKDLDFESSQNVKVSNAKFTKNKLELTFDKEVKDIDSDCFKLTYKDETGVLINYADIEKIEKLNDNKKIILSFKNIINLSHIQNAKVNLEIACLGNNFEFENNQNELSIENENTIAPEVNYSIIDGRYVKLDNFGKFKVKYALSNNEIIKGLDWTDYTPNSAFDVGPLYECFHIQIIEPSTNKVLGIQSFDIKRFGSFLEPQLTNDKKYIVNVNNLMEYSVGNSGYWQPVTKSYIDVTELNAKYKFRFRADNINKIFSSDIKEMNF